MRRQCVLLIEDHEDTAEVMAELFAQLGYAVVRAASCEQALGVDLQQVDVIVSDLGLPDGSGIELLAQLRETRHVPAVALSGYGTDTDVRACKQAGFERHLTKPVDFARLIETLESLIGAAPAGVIVG